MTVQILGQELAQRLIEALNLPPRVRWLELRMEVGMPVTIRLEQLADLDSEKLLAVLSEYTLVEKPKECAEE